MYWLRTVSLRTTGERSSRGYRWSSSYALPSSADPPPSRRPLQAQPATSHRPSHRACHRVPARHPHGIRAWPEVMILVDRYQIVGAGRHLGGDLEGKVFRSGRSVRVFLFDYGCPTSQRSTRHRSGNPQNTTQSPLNCTCRITPRRITQRNPETEDFRGPAKTGRLYPGVIIGSTHQSMDIVYNYTFI